MTRQFYDKLVRDRIPEIIAASGHKAHIDQLASEEFVKALKVKLVEEAQEVQVATDASLRTELADLQEVIDALLGCYGISRQEVEAEQNKRRTERGAFTRQIKLLWVE